MADERRARMIDAIRSRPMDEGTRARMIEAIESGSKASDPLIPIMPQIRLQRNKIIPLLLILLGSVIVLWTYVGAKGDEPSASRLADAWERGCSSWGDFCSKTQLESVTDSVDYLGKTYWEASLLLGLVVLGAGVWKYRQR